MMYKAPSLLTCLLFTLLITGCNSDNSGSELSEKSEELRTAIEAEANGAGLTAYTLPDDGEYDDIPQDPNNPITPEKVALGQLLYHETRVSTAGLDGARNGTWSCASCHHVAAGFKAGIPQGIAEGGEDFGLAGEERVLTDDLGSNFGFGTGEIQPDVQGIASPAVLNAAYQDVMLWNGALGKTAAGINVGVATVDSAGPPTILANTFGLSGLETQALAGTNVHRLNFDTIDTDANYTSLYAAAYSNDEGTIPSNGTTVTRQALGAAKAIAAYERTILANQAPFQQWLKGNENAMTLQQIEGALLFFGKAGCSDCHKGPALSSEVGASEDEIFFNIGFADFDPSNPQILSNGAISADFTDGRGGFTGDSDDNFKFKIPQLYNLTDTTVLGHGASFTSVQEVIEYKNAGVPQDNRGGNIDSRFTALGLSTEEITQLTDFIENGLYDHSLSRHVPNALPTTGMTVCFPVADAEAKTDLGCP